MTLQKKLLNDLISNWKKIGKTSSPQLIEIELAFYKKLLNFFQIGDYYYFIFNPTEYSINYISENMETILGYKKEEFNTQFFLNCIHPDDLPYFVDFEATVVDFKTSLPPDKLMKYKSRYNYRIRKKDGSYIHILQQSITIQTDNEGAALQNLVIHTDISEYKTDTKMCLSFIGMDNEPSYIDYQPRTKFIPSNELFTSREKEIISLISQNYSTEEIANILFISPATVRTHRQNINKKADANNPLELIMKAIRNGWI